MKFTTSIIYVLSFERRRLRILTNTQAIKILNTWKEDPKYEHAAPLPSQRTHFESDSIRWIGLCDATGDKVRCLSLLEKIDERIILWNVYVDPQHMNYGAEMMKAFATQKVSSQNLFLQPNCNPRWKLEYCFHRWEGQD